LLSVVYIRFHQLKRRQTVSRGKLNCECFGQCILIKAWDEKADLPFKKGQHVTVRNVQTHIYRRIVSLNTTDETDTEVCCTFIIIHIIY